MELTRNFKTLETNELKNIDGGSFLLACGIITTGAGVFKLGVEVGHALNNLVL
ncbi:MULTISPECIES: bacteriocin [Clostridium]|uniref:Bacteriocin n=1 Tax=Clostridium frigoriphilum TaxID=443253 RepID=A0ABU7UQR5_9CLOT|nr:bacteriocin [Clostridium sp. DSM 17811]MBU3100270.1 bacteriocin [Clostridium sp. DSM 17811]